jgi:hypothetical protein
VITIKKCKKVLEKNGDKYTDEQVKQISDLLKEFASLSVNEYHKAKHDEKSHNHIESIQR